MVAGVDYFAIGINRTDEINIHAAVPLPNYVAAGIAGCDTRRNQARFHIRLGRCAKEIVGHVVIAISCALVSAVG